jgi:predicted Zn-dependent protease
MKRKEKEHLKADPFVHFVEISIAFFKDNRRQFLIGAGMILLVVITFLVVFLFSSLSSAGENKLYVSAFRIRTAANMNVDQKIAKLQELQFKKGISAVGRLFIAALYYEKGDLQNAEKNLNDFPGSRIAIINDEKQMLAAQVLAARGKSKEAINLLTQMLSTEKTKINKDAIIMLQAKMQIKNQQKQEAVASLKRILVEFPNSPTTIEAQNLLSAIQGPDTLDQ